MSHCQFYGYDGLLPRADVPLALFPYSATSESDRDTNLLRELVEGNEFHFLNAFFQLQKKGAGVRDSGTPWHLHVGDTRLTSSTHSSTSTRSLGYVLGCQFIAQILW